MAEGRLVGIARKARPRVPVEPVDHAHIGLDTGVSGDFRGALRPGKSNRRQVTVMTLEDWNAALAELAVSLDWTARRANLLVSDLVLPRYTGARLRIGDDAVLEVTGECDPCSRMEEAAPGLKAVLLPDWRGGRITRVIAEGDVRIGDRVTIEEVA